MSNSKQQRNTTGTILSGDFLLDPKVRRYWPMLIYAAILAGISINSGHRLEVKVHKMETMRTEMKELNSQYIDTRSRLMNESARSKVVFRASALGLVESHTPPKKIRITNE